MAWNDGFSDDPGGDHPHYVGGDPAAAGPRPAALPAVRRPMAVLGMAGRGGPASYPCKYFPAPGPCAALAAGGPGGPFPARGGAAPGVPCSGRPLRSAGAGGHPGGADRSGPGGGRRPPGSAVSGARRCAALALAVRSGRSRAVAWDRIPALPRPCKALGKAGDGPGGCGHAGGTAGRSWGSRPRGSWWNVPAWRGP